jgi:hypothetical protein
MVNCLRDTNVKVEVDQLLIGKGIGMSKTTNDTNCENEKARVGKTREYPMWQ